MNLSEHTDERGDAKMDVERYRVKENQKVKLGDFATRRDVDVDKNEVKEDWMPANLSKMAELQEKLFAEDQYSVLVVFQAMDAAGKDGAIKHVMSGFNPQGVHVSSFKVPSGEENDHDYLWRIHKQTPRRGEIGIFNRSHYEDVIVARVHDLVEKSQIPPELVTEAIWEQRYRQIRDFERHLAENGTCILKFFLHVSKDEQRERLLDRINKPAKNWKFSAGDTYERQHWDEYMQAYEKMLRETSTESAPWYVLPADNKWYTRFLVSEVILNKLKELDLHYPALSQEDAAEMEKAKSVLEADAAKEGKE